MAKRGGHPGQGGRPIGEPDGTERLCRALYDGPANPKAYLGGSDARMLHDAADTIARLTRERDEARAEVERLRAGLSAEAGALAYRHAADPCPEKISGAECYVCTVIEQLRALLASAETEEER